MIETNKVKFLLILIYLAIIVRVLYVLYVSFWSYNELLNKVFATNLLLLVVFVIIFLKLVYSIRKG
jgi:hypothetical protein